jgi:3-phosphoglycerate kinase
MQGTYKKLEDNVTTLRGKRILLRLDLNVPVEGENVRDDFRVQSALPTIRMIKEAGGRIVILSHLEKEGKQSLLPVAKYLNSYFALKFAKDFAELEEKIGDMKDGDIVMFENLRFDPGEKANSLEFAKKLARLGDIYVNDAFSVCHREHASVVSIPKLLPSYAGPLLSKEISSLSIAFNPPHPFVFILGGAKFDTKIPLVTKFLSIADHVVILGALANDVYREYGYEVGTSTVSKANAEFSSIVKNPKVFVPMGVVVESPRGVQSKNADEVLPDEAMKDFNSSSIAAVADIMSNAQLILWNGPLGEYENGFSDGTKELAKEIVHNTATSVVGGGDTVAAIRSLGLLEKFSFVSTGGGAMLDFLSRGTLPGVEVLKE